MSGPVEFERNNRHYNFLRIWCKRYYHAKSRVEGRSTNSSIAKGKELLSKEEFLEWCMEWDNLAAFINIYFEWAESGFMEHLSPSIDRVDNNKGYSRKNIQWLSVADNLEKKDREEGEDKKSVDKR